MIAVPFNTLKFARRLEAVGFPPEQAGEAAEALAEAMADGEMATKVDVLDVRNELKNDLHSVETRLENRMELLRRDLTIRTGGMFIVAVGVLLTGMRLML